MTDELEDRLRAADPANSAGQVEPPPGWISHLVEETMKEETPSKGRRWQVPAAAAAVLVLSVGGYAVAQNNSNAPPQQPPAGQSMKLVTQVYSPGTGACIRLTAGTLAKVPVAFSGTVESVGKRAVLLRVDHWYRGGRSGQVEISAPDVTHIAVEGVVRWSVGRRYLVSATRGVVDGCGFTTRWDAQTAALFAGVFG